MSRLCSEVSAPASRSHAPRGRTLSWWLLSLLAIAACADQNTAHVDERRAIDTRLLAALGIAQGLQHEADLFEARGEGAAARAKIDEVLAIEFPSVPEREDVRLDAFGRLAELHLVARDDAAAESAIARGLAESTRTSYFRARLYLVRGRVHEARAAAARTNGDEERARAEGRAAIDAYDRGIAINREVLGMAKREGDAQ
jgi:hypothetical protein